MSKYVGTWELVDKICSQIGSLKKGKYDYLDTGELVQELVDEIKVLRESNRKILKEASKGEEGKHPLMVIKVDSMAEHYKNLYLKAVEELKKARWRASFYTTVHERSRILTSLHYVWCLGYCHTPLESMTPLFIEDAKMHVKKMKTWWKAYQRKRRISLFEGLNPKETEELIESIYLSELDKNKAQEKMAGEQVRDLMFRDIDQALEKLRDE